MPPLYVPLPGTTDYSAQTAWSIDESNVTGVANDSNSGADDAHPLLSADELIRRVGRWNIPAGSTVVVRWLSDTTHSTLNLSAIAPASLATGGVAPSLIFLGVPTVIRSGTLTGVSDAPWTVADSSLATSWSAAGCLSTSSGVRIIRKTDGTKHAFMGYENVAKTAQTSPTTGYTASPVAAPGTAAASFVNGESYEVISVPKFPRVTCPQLAAGFNGTYFIYLDAAGFTGGRANVRLSGFRNFASIAGDNVAGATSVLGGAWISGGAFSASGGATGFDRCIVLGSALQCGPWPGDNNSFVNVIAKAGQLRMSHDAFGRLGTLYAYDCTGTAIQLDNLANCTIDAIHGSGNAGTIVDVRDSGCSVNSASTIASFDATTGAANPVTIVGVGKAWAALPFWSATQNAGFVTN